MRSVAHGSILANNEEWVILRGPKLECDFAILVGSGGCQG
jgi:hypothetical protein